MTKAVKLKLGPAGALGALAIIVLACYPQFKGEVAGAKPAVVASVEDSAADSFVGSVIVGIPDVPLNECLLSMTGQIVLLAVRTDDSDQFTVSNRTVDCSSVKVLSAEEVSAALGVKPGIYHWGKPLLGKNPGFGVSLLSPPTSIFIGSEDQDIQVIYSSFGNREGVETGHLYAVEQGSILTKSLESRKVVLEAMADW